MSQVVIENPVISSPFSEPARHFKFAKFKAEYRARFPGRGADKPSDDDLLRSWAFLEIVDLWGAEVALRGTLLNA